MADRARWTAAWLAIGLALAPVSGHAAAPAVAADPYLAALESARGEAEAGRWGEAADVLTAAAPAWPQDFPLQLQRAFYLLRAGRYPEAAAGYRAALELSPDDAAAHRGLDDADAGRGAPTQWWVGLHGAGTSWRDHPARRSLAAGVITADAVLRDRWTLGLVYRGLAAPGTGGGGRAGRGGSALPVVSHEAQAVAGLAGARWTVALHGAAASRSAATVAGVEQVYGYGGAGAALAASLRLGLVWRASAALVAWEDRTVPQLEGAAALLLGHHLTLQAGWRGQRLGGSTAGAALAGVAWSGPWSIALRGELGAQRRPWDLEGRALYGLPETLRSALRLEAGLPLSSSLRAWLGADLERWRVAAPAGGDVDATATRLGAGLILSF